jgi:hypothetical protein
MTCAHVHLSTYGNIVTLGIESGPCGFLTVLPVVQGGAQYVSVAHALRQCGNRSGVHSFIGDTHPPRLPTIKL